MPNLSGETLGPYRVLESLGQGGMATVYKGYHTRLDHYVAIKVLASFLADEPGFHERFRQEGVVLARLRHPHIVTVHDAAEDRGYAYMVTDYVDGGSLADRIGKPLPVEEVVRLLMPIASALDYAHARNVLHRDVKPSNILLWKDGTPVLADFGISRLAEGTTRLTRTGMVVGTPEYMAPELALEGQAGPAADQYALAIVAYELLTGRVPFRMETPLGVLMAQAQQAPPPPRSINPALDPAVEAALMKGLAKRPEDRYPNVEAFVQALSTSGGQPIAPPAISAAGVAETVVEVPTITSSLAAPAPVTPPPAAVEATPSSTAPVAAPTPAAPPTSPPTVATGAASDPALPSLESLPALEPVPQLPPVTFGDMKPVTGAGTPAASPQPSPAAPAPPAGRAAPMPGVPAPGSSQVAPAGAPPSRPAGPAGTAAPARPSGAPAAPSAWIGTPPAQPRAGIPTAAILGAVIVLLLVVVVAASRLLHLALVSGASAPAAVPTATARSAGAAAATTAPIATVAPTVTAVPAVPTAIPTTVPATAVPPAAATATPIAVEVPGQQAAAAGAAGSITPGGKVVVTIASPGQKRRLTFQGAAGQRVSLRAEDNTIGDVQVSILRPEGQSVTSTAFGGDGFLDTAKLPVAGTYTVEVAPLQASAGSVSLTLYDVPADVASPLSPGGSPTQVTLTTPGQKARLPLQGTAGQRVSLKATDNTIGDVQIQILRPEGQAVGGTAIGGDGFIDAVKLPVAGTYTVVVAPLGPNVGGITLTPYNVPPDVATPISPGGPPVPVNLTVPGQKGRLPFTGTAGQKVSLHVSQNTVGDVQVQIVRPDGQNLAGTATGGDATVDAVALPLAGQYVVFVAPLGPNVGSVTVALHNAQ